MKVLVITGSRADLNCQTVVHQALEQAGHTSWLEDVDEVFDREVSGFDVAVVAGDRIEILETAVHIARHHKLIAHIGGGDITEGSADNRYRDAITALACIHCVETVSALDRLLGNSREQMWCARVPTTDYVVNVGQPGLDLIRQTVPVRPPPFIADDNGKPKILLLVHPNTIGCSTIEVDAIIEALKDFDANVLPLEPNKDPGNELVTAQLFKAFGKVISNRPPAEFYWLLQHCDVLLGNSSAGTAEAACFGIPVVNVGDRQKGRQFGPKTLHCDAKPSLVEAMVRMALESKRGEPWANNPYGDGNSAPRIVKALEDNAWRWSNQT